MKLSGQIRLYANPQTSGSKYHNLSKYNLSVRVYCTNNEIHVHAFNVGNEKLREFC